MKKLALCAQLLCLSLATTPAFADQKLAEGMGNGAISQMFLLVAFVGIFYFLILRPQSKRTKEHQQLVTHLQKGDEVLSNGGLLGRIESIQDNFLRLTLAEGCSVWIQRQAIASVMPKGTLKALV